MAGSIAWEVSMGVNQLDRRVAVAPMMDWADEVQFAF